MQAAYERNIQYGSEYDPLFPAPLRSDPVIKENAGVRDTVAFVKEMAYKGRAQTAKIAKLLQGKTRHETCANIWNFVYRHIRYRLDEKGVEQVRSPARTWADRREGVDCDCYSTFIGSILINLGIPHSYRITKYRDPDTGRPKKDFQHIYPIVPVRGERLGASPNRADYLVLDCVKDAYNDEHPFVQNEDSPMDLVNLNGFGSAPVQYGADDYTLLGDLGRSVSVHRRRGGKVSAKEVPTPTPGAAAQPAADSSLVNPALVPIAAPATITYNKGVLKDGRMVELSEELLPSPRSFVSSYGGSSNGQTFSNRKLLVNGVWDGKSGLMRFIVKDGILRGVNTDGTYFMDSSNHAGLVRVRGVNIKNPGISLGELPQDLNSLYSLSMVNGVGEINENPVPSRAGLFIDYPTLEILFNKRLKGQPASVNGLGALAALLGEEGMSVLEGHIMGLGDFEYGGRDDINGLEGDGEMEFSGMNGLSGLGQYLGFNAAGDSIAVMDGLGITRHVRVRRRGAAAPAAAPAANAAPAPPSEKKIGLYVPVNTLRNLFKLRAANLARLQANGHLISSGTVPTAINGLGDFGEIGSWFSNITNSINKAASFISPVANFLPVPGLSTVVNIAKTGSGLVQKLTGGNESPWAAATREALAKQDYTARYLDESKEPYNISVTENLQGIPVVDSAISYAKENPVKTVLGVAAAGAVVWYLWPAKKSGKTLGGTPAKKTGGKDKKGTKNYIMAAIK